MLSLRATAFDDCRKVALLVPKVIVVKSDRPVRRSVICAEIGGCQSRSLIAERLEKLALRLIDLNGHWVHEDGQAIGRIRLARERSVSIWLWHVAVNTIESLS